MELLFNENIHTEGINISNINSSNTEIKIIPYKDPLSEKLLNLTKYNLTWFVKSLKDRKMKIKLNLSDPDAISTFST